MVIPRLFFNNARKLKKKTALLCKDQNTGLWNEVSWETFDQKVRKFASYLLRQGIKKGDRVAILAENCPEWAMADLAALSIGAVTVPIYFTSTSSQVEYILRDSGSKLVLVSTPEQMQKVNGFEAEENQIRIVLLQVGSGNALPAGVESFSRVIEEDADPSGIEPLLENIAGDDIASILYTSGTTGPPKGVVLSHGNFLSNATACMEVVPVTGEDLFLSFLPLSHAFERTVGYYVPLLSGAAIAYAESIDDLNRNIAEVRPTIMLGVPRFYEKTHAAIIDAVDKGSRLKRALFNRAVDAGKDAALLRNEGKSIPPVLRLRLKAADLLVYKKIRGRIGGRLRFFVSGGAPLSREVNDFFEALGLIILEGYGLTETSPVITSNTMKYRKKGTVGKALPGVEIRIADDGEILAKGPGIMKGYYGRDDLTDEVIVDGWFHTGDIGIIDNEGFLKITDRKKDIIVTSGGKNVAPQNIEMALTGDRLISQVMVYGEGRKFLTALIVPNFNELKSLAARKGIKSSSIKVLINMEEIRAIFAEQVEERLIDFASYEKIKKFALLPEEFSMDRDEITPTLKIKRKVVAKRYGPILEDLYREEDVNRE